MREQPRHLLVGQMETALTVRPSGPVLMLGARFTATGLRRLLPVPQDRIAGQIIALDTVWNRWTRQTADQIASASGPAGQFDAFERALERLLPAEHAEGCDRGVDAVVASPGIPRRCSPRPTA